jgi:catechol 2,3-dioxygenase-like lactoylglutathione lyase family enzyme
VQDVEAVVKWYTDVMGFQLIGSKIVHIKRSEDPSAAIFSIYGSSLQEVKLAYMATGNGVGFEVFQFLDPGFKKLDAEFEYNRGGFFHICVTDSNPEALAETVAKEGGSRIGTTVDLGIAHCLYVKDPWGNVIEILDMSFERLTTQLIGGN